MAGNAIVSELLSKGNYEQWSIQMRTYLYGQELWDIVDPDAPLDYATLTETEMAARNKKNAIALHAIQISCDRNNFHVIKEKTTAKTAWMALDEYAIVSELLSKGNYEQWSIQMRTYLYGQELWDIVDPDAPLDYATLTETEMAARNKKNAIALHAIQISCDQNAFHVIKEKTSAKTAWTALDDYCRIKPDARPQVAHDWENQPLFKAVYDGDWVTAKLFLDQHPGAVRVRGPGLRKNALHIAVTEEHLHIVERLVEQMTDEELEMERDDRFTALAAAVEVGNLSIAKCLLRKNKRLIGIAHKVHGLPVAHAVTSGQMQMVPYLYSATPDQDLTHRDEGRLGAFLLAQCILVQQFDIALHLLERAPLLAITDDAPGRSPVFALAHSKVFPSGCSLKFWQRWIYKCIRIPTSATKFTSSDIRNTEDSQRDTKDITRKSSVISRTYKRVLGLLRWVWSYLLNPLDIKSIYKLKLLHVQSLELLKLMCKAIEGTSDETKIKKAGVHDALIQAVNAGNVEFVTSIAKANPSLVWNPYVAKTVLEVAVELRQPKIFSLIFGLREKVAIVNIRDGNGNNMIHKAAAVAPSRLLNLIPGAALQMQRELQWFKEVEAIASPSAREWTNTQYLKPRALFTENHKHLVAEGEKWMKNTASSSTVVGALIITVTFAAAFTFAGGNHQDTGFPMFLDRKYFKVFMMSNAVALFTSITSVLMFLGILTSRYGEDDFLKSLPRKLIIGLSTLFLSMAAMIIAFCAGLSLMFHRKSWIVIPSICLASITVVLFVLMQFPLLVDILISTYGPSIFDRKVKRWI